MVRIGAVVCVSILGTVTLMVLPSSEGVGVDMVLGAVATTVGSLVVVVVAEGGAVVVSPAVILAPRLRVLVGGRAVAEVGTAATVRLGVLTPLIDLRA